ncbi:hypothetical protein [Bordetella hinzii]|uniref:hypothetical protein n=1 Tax=Bordetella hinzii TaxID=103855 RepID=UPI00197AE1D4|nr:hypothetical protein [Bordetella hinzii]
MIQTQGKRVPLVSTICAFISAIRVFRKAALRGLDAGELGQQHPGDEYGGIVFPACAVPWHHAHPPGNAGRKRRAATSPVDFSMPDSARIMPAFAPRRCRR